MDVTSGDTVSVTLDTVSDASTFDPTMWINDGASCTFLEADDSFDCAFPPPSGYQCPSGQFTASSDGTYQVVVRSAGDCDGSSGDYALSVDAASDPTLTLVADDIARFGPLAYVLDVSLSGTVSAPD